MELESLSDLILAVFVGTLLAHLCLWVLTGRGDELRTGIRGVLGGSSSTSSKEAFHPARLEDYE